MTQATLSCLYPNRSTDIADWLSNSTAEFSPSVHRLCISCVGCSQPLSRVLLFATPWTVAHQAPLSMGFSRQEYWSGLPFPPPRIKPASLASPALDTDSSQGRGYSSHSRDRGQRQLPPFLAAEVLGWFGISSFLLYTCIQCAVASHPEGRK